MLLSATLTFDARSKSRLLLRLNNGEQAALIVERGHPLGVCQTDHECNSQPGKLDNGTDD